jgi:hypothetical protein
MKWLEIIAYVGIITALIALPFCFYYFRRAPIRSMLLLGVPLLIAGGSISTTQTVARDELIHDLNSLPDTSNVTIGGHPASNPAQVLQALKSLAWITPHHSNPTKRIDVEITHGSSRILLALARDSGDPREYWVFFPKYYFTRYNETGRIRTSLLDEY